MSVDTQSLNPAEMTTALQAARQRGAEWIVSRIADDGKPVGGDEVNHYYRVPWALAVAGHTDAAAAVMTWIEREALTPAGDLRPGAAQTNWNRAGWTKDAASYPLAIIGYGAWHLERFDTAGAIMDALVPFQNPKTGGGYIERPEAEHRTTGRQDLLCTAQLALTALITGRREMADAAFGWLQRFWADQPALPNRLYLATTEGGELATEVPAGQEFGYYMDVDKPRQAFFNPGIGAAFAARYIQTTRDTTGIEIARGLLDFSDRCSDTQYDFSDTIHVGKFAWGLGTTLNLEPSETQVARALRMGQWFLDSQEQDGRWNPTKFLVPEPDDADGLWKTAEHIVLMTIVELGLASNPRTVFGK